MKSSQNRDAFLTMALVLAVAGYGAMGCGARGGEQLSDNEKAAICEPGVTRECVGPGACRGGQICNDDARWEVCECTLGVGAGNGAAGKGSGGAANHSTTTNIAGNYSNAAPGGTTSTSRGGTGNGGTTGPGKGGTTSNGGTTGPSKGGATSNGGTTGTSTGGTSVATTDTGVAGSTFGGTSTTSLGGQSFGDTSSTAVGGTILGGSGGAGTGGATNQPPVIVNLAFSSTAIAVRDTLWVYPKATDPESDAVTFSYAWTRNGQPVGGDTNQLYGGSYFAKGDSIRVTVTPRDRNSTGVSVTSEAIVVRNSSPYVEGMATIYPGTYVDDSADLECVASAWDNDGDPITYGFLWYLNEVATSNTSSTLPASATSSGDRWSCEVTVSDGGGGDPSTSRSVVTDVSTQVSGIYRSDVTWLASKSPYYLSNRVQIAAGATLTIEPGVRLYGNEQYLESWGNISAKGTKDKPILITSLHLVDNSTAAAPGKLNLAFVEYKNGEFLASSANVVVTVADSVFQYIWNVVSLNAPAPASHRFERNVFYGACGIQSAGPLTLINNVFSQSSSSCIDVVAVDSLTATHNSFLDADSAYEVELGAKPGDLRANYWGGVDDADVPGRILDNNDSLTIQGLAEYLPTLPSAHVDTPPPDKTYETLQ